MRSREPTPDECKAAARKAVEPTREALEKAGVTGELLAKKLLEELNSQEIRAFCNTATNGRVVYSRALPNWEIRQKARIDAHTLRGDYPADGRNPNPQTGGTAAIPISIRVEFVGPSSSQKS